MKVLMVSRYLPPVYAGQGKQALSVAQLLADNANDVRVVGVGACHGYQKRAEGLAVHYVGDGFFSSLRRVRPFGILAEYLLGLRVAVYLRRVVKAYDLVYCIDASQMSTFAINLSTVFHVPSIACSTLMGADDPLYIQERKPYASMGTFSALKRVGAFRAIGPAIMKSYLDSKLPPHKVVLVPPVIDERSFVAVPEERKQQLRRSLGLSLDKVLVIFTGMVSYRKGIDRLIQAWREMMNDKTSASSHLLLVGPVDKGKRKNRSFYEQMLQQIDAYDIKDSISFIGEVDNVGAYLSASDVFVFLSRNEGMPAAVAEATMSGLPVVMSNLPGISDYLVEHGRTGFIVDGDNSTEVANALTTLMGDKQLRRQFGSATRERALDRFSREVIYHKHEKLFDVALTNRP